MPAFWHWFITIGTVLFTIWCIWLISWSAKQGPQDIADDQVVGHKWDGDLEEWNNSQYQGYFHNVISVSLAYKFRHQ